ncbi:M64 family metallopeptidase [Nonomuraea typhae]|uniref:M64 family metallopeptidase n=1 Tax=Nonomuraea typhae TaxID=2603600 RepID=UPI0012F82F53|nr:M64 family metallopeptidase [Nonomuraea typhae]
MRATGALAALSLAGALIVHPAPASAAEPGAATVVPVQVTGDPGKRFNLILLGDGYTQAEQAAFKSDVDRHLNVMWSIEPFKSYRNYINVYRVDIVSGESGISCDPDLTSPRKNTPLRMGFWGQCNPQSVQRLITMDNAAATRYANLVTGTTSGNRQILALGNSKTYGGAGGSYATASGSNAMSALISPHELGHSLGGLQDEYDYYQRGVPGGAYTGPEPASAHHTLLTERQMLDQRRKWWRWLGEESESGGPIARFEGGLYASTGVWRPSRHSMMKSLGYYFDQVSREVMVQRITAKTDVIQGSAPTGSPVGADRVLWVEPMRPPAHALAVSWSVDGAAVPTTEDALDLRTLNLTPGRHTVTATVSDPTGFVRDPAIKAALTRSRTWTVDTSLTTPPDGVTPGIVSSSPTTRAAGGTDVMYVQTTHPAKQLVPVTWTLDGVRAGDSGSDFALKDLAPGTHTLTAAAGGDTVTWTVDASPPATAYELSEPLVRDGDLYLYNGPFTMRLTGRDDRNGYIVSESRVDRDGWFNYFGWPTSADLPWTFSENGTVIDHLVYGKLPRGRHTIEYRSIDAAGNHGQTGSFRVSTTAPPPACDRTVTGTHRGPLVVSSGVTCLEAARVTGPISVRQGASLVMRGGSVAGAVSARQAAQVHLLKGRVDGAVDIRDTEGALVIAGAEVRGAVVLRGNEAPTLAGSTVRGALACSGNSAAPVNLGAANRVTGIAAGQCAGAATPDPDAAKAGAALAGEPAAPYEAVGNSAEPEHGDDGHRH